MKKTVSTLLICSLLAVFFCVPVNAATSQAVTRYKVIRSSTNNNVNVDISAVQFYPSVDSNAVLDSTYEGVPTYRNNFGVVVTVAITNNNSKSAYIDGLFFNITFNDTNSGATGISAVSRVLDIHNFSNDLVVGIDGTSGHFSLNPAVSWSFMDHICIPSNTTITAVCLLEFTDWNIHANGNETHNFATIQSVNLTQWSAYTTDFTPPGAHDDLLLSLEALRSFLIGNNGLPLIDSDLDDILSEVVSGFTAVENRLTNIQNILTWAGSYNLPAFGTRSSVSYTYETGKHTVNTRSFSGIPITDFEAIPPNIIIKDVLYRIPVNVIIITNYTEDKSFDTYYIDNLFSASDYYVDSVNIDSSWIVTADFTVNNGAYRLYVRSDDRVIPQGYKVSNIKFDVYSRNPSVVLNAFVVNTNLTQYVSDVESQSDSLINQSNQAHTQEQAFFNQNSQAIADTGLGNFQFSSDQSSGISVVTGLFNRLWTSVGSWNTVYVFSLTLTVALTILRYTTNAIRRRSYTDEKGGKP